MFRAAGGEIADDRSSNFDEIEFLARRRAGAKLGWYVHAAAFVVVNLVVFGMSRYGFGNRPWSVFPLLGWGLGLVILLFFIIYFIWD